MQPEEKTTAEILKEIKHQILVGSIGIIIVITVDAFVIYNSL